MISCFTKLNLDSICSLSSTFSIIVCEKKYPTRRSVYTNTHTHTHTEYAVSAFAVVCFLIAPCLSSFLSSSFLSSSSSLHLLSLLFFMVMSPLFILDLRLFLTIYLKNEHPKPINCCCRLRRNCRHPRHHPCLICILYCSDFRSKEDSVCVFYSLRSRACRAHGKPTQCYRDL